MADFSIGIDLGGTKIAAALVNRQGKIHAQRVEATLAEEGPEPVIGRIAGLVKSLISEGDGSILGIGVGAAGMTDSRSGVVLMASNLKWKNVPLKDLLVKKIGAEWSDKVVVDKDTNAAVLGEMLFGAGMGSRHLFYVTVGTGIGGGMVVDGRLYHGASEGASDFGHLVLEENGPLCGCGKHGCLEALASGPAIARIAREMISRGTSSDLQRYPPEEISAETVVQSAKKGDKLAFQVIENAGKMIGRGLALYCDINNPDHIIIGGGVATACGDLLFTPIRRTVEIYALPNNARAVQILPAGLKADSGVIGAAALVWGQLE